MRREHVPQVVVPGLVAVDTRAADVRTNVAAGLTIPADSGHADACPDETRLAGSLRRARSGGLGKPWQSQRSPRSPRRPTKASRTRSTSASRADKTLKNVRGAWVAEQKVKVDKGRISEYRVTMRVSFVLED